MLNIQTNQTAIRRVQGEVSSSPVSDQELEQAIGASLIGDFNEQLAGISDTMRSQLAAKQGVREDLARLGALNTRTTAETPQGEEAVVVTDKEYSELVKSQPGLQFKKLDSGGYYLTKESLKNAIEGNQEKLAGLNSNTEITMLQIQSLVDQRKNALMMLSNLMSARNETMSGIIRNLKN